MSTVIYNLSNRRQLTGMEGEFGDMFNDFGVKKSANGELAAT